MTRSDQQCMTKCVCMCVCLFFTFCMSSSSCSSSSLVMLYCCSSTRAKYSMARMDSLSFRVTTMSWNGEKTTVRILLDKEKLSRPVDGRMSEMIRLSASSLFWLGVHAEASQRHSALRRHVRTVMRCDFQPSSSDFVSNCDLSR